MKNFGKKLVLFIESLSEYTGYLAGFTILASALVLTEGVLTRLFGGSVIWQNELSVYLLILSIFIGASYTQKRKGHLGVDLVTSHLAPKPRAIIALTGSVLGFLVCVILARYLWPYWWQQKGYSSGTFWNPSLVFPYILIPLGMTLLALEYIAFMYREYSDYRKGTAKAESKSAETFSPHSQLPPHADKPKAGA
jgi:C4-dicarboxylate transporter, DctQ subunit